MIQAGMVNDLVSFRNQAKSGTYIQKTVANLAITNIYLLRNIKSPT